MVQPEPEYVLTSVTAGGSPLSGNYCPANSADPFDSCPRGAWGVSGCGGAPWAEDTRHMSSVASGVSPLLVLRRIAPFCQAGEAVAFTRRPSPAGYYCPEPGVKIVCPKGYFCPDQTVTPQRCGFLLECNKEGIGKPQVGHGKRATAGEGEWNRGWTGPLEAAGSGTARGRGHVFCLPDQGLYASR